MPKRNLAWILIVAAIALLMWQLPQMIAGRDSVIRDFGPLVDARTQIQKRYVERVDEDRLVRDAVRAAISAMISDLNDPHAIYLSENDYRRFQKRTDGLYGGIGVEVWAVDDGLEVLSREPDSPAVRAGIRPGDIITHIEGRSIRGFPIVEAVNSLLNGPIDTQITLTVRRPGESSDAATRELTLYRGVIKLDPVHGWARREGGGWHYIIDPQHRIAYIRLVKFTTDVDERLDAEVHKLLSKNLRGLILDLRENTGGLLDSAREVADRFLGNNELIVRTGGRTADTKQWFASPEGTYPRIPVAVLVNGTTASAAEIVAGALRDHKRAIVVGERTYGKGSVQEVVELMGANGAIKLTTAYYYLPNGECIHRTPANERSGTWGVLPNLVVRLTDEQRKEWEAAWRDIARERLREEGAPADGEPSTGDESIDVATSPDADEAPDAITRVESEALRLIERDPQLRAALEQLQRVLAPKDERASAGASRPGGPN